MPVIGLSAQILPTGLRDFTLVKLELDQRSLG
jgi:hypothetical protein